MHNTIHITIPPPPPPPHPIGIRKIRHGTPLSIIQLPCLFFLKKQKYHLNMYKHKNLFEQVLK